MTDINMIIAGVEGQGSTLASHILAMSAIKEGMRARVGETFGAAMRGGAVASHIRIGKDVHAPLIPCGGADVVLALEPLEGLRNVVDFLSKGGLLLTNTHAWLPVDVNIGRAKYPSMAAIKSAVDKLGGKVVEIDADKLAQDAGNIRTVNVVMLGALAATEKLPFSVETLKQVVRENVPPKTIEVNIRAFEIGFNAFKK